MSLRWRRGGGVTQSGGGAAIYGPTMGRAAVIAGVGPRPVTNPGGGVSFNSSGSLQSAINAQATGTTFICSSNAPVWNSTVSTGTKRPTIIFPGAAGQVVINGSGADIIALQAGDGTTVLGGTWQNFGTTGFGHGIITQDDVTIQDAIITDCHFKGVDIQGHRAQISYCKFHTNGMMGIGTGNTGLGQTDDLLIEHCEIYGNNTDLTSPGASGSGSKMLLCARGTYRENYIHDNLGFGMWWDTSCYSWLIENNVSENNSFAGLMYEANYGSTIRNNYIGDNGRNVAIGPEPATVQNTVNIRFSDNPADTVAADGVVHAIEFANNLVDHVGSYGGNTGNLILIWDHTDSAVRHAGNHDIHNNQFWLRNTTANRIRAQDLDQIGLPATTNYQIWNLNNRYSFNEYRVASLATSYWSWDTGTGQGVTKTWAEWITFHPTDGPRI